MLAQFAMREHTGGELSAPHQMSLAAASKRIQSRTALPSLFHFLSHLYKESVVSLYGISELADSMAVVRKNTIIIAEEIPESDYHFRPTQDSRSVAETLIHIAGLWRFDLHVHDEAHLDSIEDFDIGGLIEDGRIEEQRPRPKAEIIDLLRTEGERQVEWVRRLSDHRVAERVRMPGGGSISRFQSLIGLKEHEMQHRAQLTVLERLLGIVPHFTRNLPRPRKASLATS